MRKWWYRFCDALGIERTAFHTMRHTYATLLMDATGNAETVSQLLGHSSVTTTLKYYTHPDERAKAEAVFSLERAMDGGER